MTSGTLSPPKPTCVTLGGSSVNMRKLSDLMNLRGRVALITGGAGHVGRAAAAALSELGCRVVLVDLAEAQPEAAANEIHRSFGAECFGLNCDIADGNAVRAIPAQLDRYNGRLDILINCAALVGSKELEGWIAPFDGQSETAWRKALEVNLTAPFLLCQALSPALKSSGHGSIINIGSIYGIAAPDWSLYEGTGMGNPAAYAASKAGLLQLTRWLAATLAPGVRVNAITPGGISRGQPSDFVQKYERRTPLARMGREEDLLGAIAYFASDLSGYVTGHNLVVDGGWTI
jgi:NAD(P)-dependent dehydrogenase (short-subunit alcohol dehydrogenase family)